MGSVAEAVRDALSRDGVVLEALRRGIVNHRALARWLIDARDLDATEEAVLSALRRCGSELKEPVDGGAQRVLAGASLCVRSRVVVLVLPRHPKIQRQLPGLSRIVDLERGQALRIIQTDRCAKVIVDEENAEEAISHLGRPSVTRTMRDLTEVEVLLPDESLETPGVLMALTCALALAGINVVEVSSGLHEHVLVVRDEDTARAYDVLQDTIKAAAAATRGDDPGGPPLPRAHPAGSTNGG